MTTDQEHSVPLWRDDRFWRVILQVLAVVVVVSIISLLWHNLTVNLARQGTELGFDFLDTQASFAIQESLIPYDPATDNYARVLLAGLLNTIRVIIPGIMLATLLGIAVGVASFSDNWLLRKGSEVYVEIIRNVPLLLQLYFWYRAVFTQFPNPEDRFIWFDSIFLSNRGVFMPWPAWTWNLLAWVVVIIVGAIAALLLWKWRTKIMIEDGQSGKPQMYALYALAIAGVLIVLFAFGWQAPTEPNLGVFKGGMRLSIEFSALITGLVVYTAAYIADIVRAGIQSVAKGQWEAARSLGLKAGLVMRLVVFPQALRVIIPPLNSQYMNLAKNSSLAIAIGYVDIYSVANTTYNQSGRPVEVMLIIMVTYLTINILITIAMNVINRVSQLKER